VVSIIAVTDLPTAIQSADMIDMMVAGANARASRVAPCLAWDGTVDGQPAPSEDQLAEAKMVLLGAVKRWSEAGSGALQAQTAGPYGVTVDTRQRTGYNLWPSEITDLQAICKTDGPTGRQAFSIDTAPRRVNGSHLPWCSIFPGEPCSCGSSINGYEGPLWEFGYGLDDI
jgi:hypothetical protein